MVKEKNNHTEKRVAKIDKTLKKCFLITPIGSEDSIEFKNLNALLDNVINVVLDKHKFEAVVAHQIHKVGSIGDQVFSEILNSDLVLANLTKLNANVMYETAVAHSFGKPTIMFAEKDTTDLPFDLIGDRTVFFEDSIKGSGNLISELDQKIEYILKEPEVDNPVYRVLQKNAIVKSLSETNENTEINNLSKLVLEMNDRLNSMTKEIKRSSFEIDFENKIKHIPQEYSKIAGIDGHNIYLHNMASKREYEALKTPIKKFVSINKRLPNEYELANLSNLGLDFIMQNVKYD